MIVTVRILLFICIIQFVVLDILAQISTDGSISPQQSLTGPDYQIDADLRIRNQSNFFHSLRDFNIRNGESATLTGPPEIDTIIGRITGGLESTINGLLRSEIDGVGLYLLNPAGFVFGADAVNDVPGAVHSSTANELRFTDGSQVSSQLATGNGFTAAAPEAFGFLDVNEGKFEII